MFLRPGNLVLSFFLLALLLSCVTSPADLESPNSIGKKNPPSPQESPPLSQESPPTGNSSPAREEDSPRAAQSRGSSWPAVSGEKKPVSSTEGSQGAVVPTRELSPGMLRDLIRPSVPERFLFVGDQEYRPLTVFRDIDDNGLEDVFVLLMEVPGEEGGISDIPVRFGSVSEAAITDMARLFSESYAFYLALFLRTTDGFVSMYRIPLGQWSVFESFRGLRIDADRNMPFAVRISFQTQEGRESLQVAFSEYNNFSFFTLKASISVSTETRDIDGDGLLDIVEWRRVFEEGTGYETFLTWFRWDGTKFSQRDSTNIVRNLNSFLEGLGKLLSGEKWGESLKVVLPPEDVSQLKEGMSDAELFERLFLPLPADIPDKEVSSLAASEEALSETPEGSGVEERTPENSSSPVTDNQRVEEADLPGLLESEGRVFSNVLFPRVWENPFSTYEKENDAGYGTRFSIRFIFRDGRSFVRVCKVRMSGNPFEDPQFYLEPLSR